MAAACRVGAESAVAGSEPACRGADERLVRVRWAGTRPPLLPTLSAADVACTKALAMQWTWHLTLRFDSHQQLADCYHRCVDCDIRLTVERVKKRDDLDQSAPRTLTPAQREALVTAHQAGYFAVAWEVTLA
jgi:hypothetical protein